MGSSRTLTGFNLTDPAYLPCYVELNRFRHRTPLYFTQSYSQSNLGTLHFFFDKVFAHTEQPIQPSYWGTYSDRLRPPCLEAIFFMAPGAAARWCCRWPFNS